MLSISGESSTETCSEICLSVRLATWRALVPGGRPDARHAFGIFYTASRLARFVAASAVSAMLDEDTELNAIIARIAAHGGTESDINEVVSVLSRRKISHLECGG